MLILNEAPIMALTIIKKQNKTFQDCSHFSLWGCQAQGKLSLQPLRANICFLPWKSGVNKVHYHQVTLKNFPSPVNRLLSIMFPEGWHGEVGIRKDTNCYIVTNSVQYKMPAVAGFLFLFFPWTLHCLCMQFIDSTGESALMCKHLNGTQRCCH